MHPAAEQEVMYLSDETTIGLYGKLAPGKKPADQEIGGEEISLSQVKPEGEQERKPRRTTRQGGQRRAPAAKKTGRPPPGWGGRGLRRQFIRLLGSGYAYRSGCSRPTLR